jgi:NAD(P)-dependent dehydrogenase (short-subunit alcohol dehydrogenase family)
MKIDLTSRVAIVTGSTQGIGFAIAQGLAAAGASVVINGRTKEKVDAAVAKLGGRASGAPADLSTAEGCAALVKAVPTCDILVNNAGVFKPVDFFDSTDADWDLHWHANVMSGVRLARAYLRAMERKGWGRVVFISSESGFNIPVEMIHYGVSKTADIAVARGLAKRMAGTGVTVNSVLPGPTMSDGVSEIDRVRFCAEQPRSRRSPIWWSTWFQNRRRRRPALHCGSMEVWSIPCDLRILGYARGDRSSRLANHAGGMPT